MLLKSSQLTDYGDPSAAVPLVPPRAAVEFIQTVTIFDFSYSSIGTALAPSIINVDVPTWANFKRYKKIQFSFGSFGPSTTGTLNLRTRRNFFTYDNTKYFTTFAPTGTAALTYLNSSASSTNMQVIATNVATTSAYIRQLDIFLSQMGGDTECLMGARQTSLPTSNINRTNFSFINPERASFPGYLESDIPGVQLLFDGSSITFRPPDFGSSVVLNNYKLECNIYGWLR